MSSTTFLLSDPTYNSHRIVVGHVFTVWGVAAVDKVVVEAGITCGAVGVGETPELTI